MTRVSPVEMSKYYPDALSVDELGIKINVETKKGADGAAPSNKISIRQATVAPEA